MRFHIAALLMGIVLQLTFGRTKGVSNSDFQILVFMVVDDQFSTRNAQVDPNLIGFTLPVMMGLGFNNDLAAGNTAIKGIKLVGLLIE